MWPNLVFLYFAVGQERQKWINHIVGEETAVGRIGDRARGVIWQDIRQHGTCHAPGVASAQS